MCMGLKISHAVHEEEWVLQTYISVINTVPTAPRLKWCREVKAGATDSIRE